MAVSRRSALVAPLVAPGFALAAAAAAHAESPAKAGSADPKAAAEAEAALRAFLKAFENCDLPAMEAAFAPDAASFDQIVQTAERKGPADLAGARRAPGMPAGMRRAAEQLPKRRPAPPYQSLTPQDLSVQATRDMALCTFHLGSGETGVGRRTIVLVRRGRDWKILHVHASSVAA